MSDAGGHHPPPPGAPPATAPPPPGASSARRPSSWWFVALMAGVVAAIVYAVMSRDGDETVRSAPTTTAAARPESTTPESTTPGSTEPVAVAPPTPSDLASAVVQVQLLLGGQVTCTGSGTIVEADGTILTNSHVIAQDAFCPHDTIGVAVLDLPELPPSLLFEADVLIDDPALDLAVIRIARALDGRPVVADFPTVEVGDSDVLQLGDRLNVIGFPGIGGDTITFTEGTISGFVSIPGLGDRSWLKTDATISGGNSGGLAADAAGRIVGVPTIVGTGDGPITDCRFVADTNGDGLVDQNDACVPVGGFINGIRPVNLAVPLLEAARTAVPAEPSPPMVDEPMSVSELPLVLGSTWTIAGPDGRPGEPAVVVPAGAPGVCLTWEYARVPTGTPVEVDWFVDGTLDPTAGFAGANDGPPEGSYFGCILDPDGLSAGTYEVAWFVGGDPVFSHAIHVGGDRTPITVEIVNQTDAALCVIQLSPVPSITFGLNRIDAAVPPGGSVRITLASGAYDQRVIDCDGALRVEAIDGLDLATDSTITLSSE